MRKKNTNFKCDGQAYDKWSMWKTEPKVSTYEAWYCKKKKRKKISKAFFFIIS